MGVSSATFLVDRSTYIRARAALQFRASRIPDLTSVVTKKTSFNQAGALNLGSRSLEFHQLLIRYIHAAFPWP
jgi:hypothetical protein